MKPIMRNVFRLVLASSILASAGAHAAGVDASSVSSRDFNLTVFAVLPSVSITLTPSDYVRSGALAADTTIATAIVQASGDFDMGHQRMAIRWSPSQTDVLTPTEAKLHGTSNNNNVIIANLSAQKGILEDIEADGWLNFTTAGKDQEAYVKSSGTQTVAADTYKIYLDAGVYSF